MKRLFPALGLLVLAPWVGEYLLGNVPIQLLVALPFLLPLYGGGALLIREVTRRMGRGWPTIFMLGLAYGVIEAGLVDQSMFNPSFDGLAFQEVTPVPVLGISALNTMVFVIGHSVWSIGVPIAIVEALTPSRSTTPWLGKVGLTVTVAVYLLGCVIIFQDHLATEGFLASPAQLAAASVAAVILIGLPFAITRRPRAPGDRWVPRPLLLVAISFVLAGLFVVKPENWVGVGVGLLVVVVTSALVLFWSSQRAWDARHRFALTAGALLTYAWCGFVLTGLLAPDDRIRWIGNAIFASIAVVLIAVAAPVVRRSVVQPARGHPSDAGEVVEDQAR